MHKNPFDELVGAMLADPSVMPGWQPKRSELVNAQKILNGLAGKQEAMTAELMNSVNEIFGLEEREYEPSC